LSTSYIYLIESIGDYETVYKIGFSKHTEKRLEQLKTGNPNKITIIENFCTKHGRKVETAFHNLYSHKRLEGEWFTLDLVDIVDFIKNCEKIEENFNILIKHDNHYL